MPLRSAGAGRRVRNPRSLSRAGAVTAVLCVVLVGCADPEQQTSSGPSSTADGPSTAPEVELPELSVEVLAEGLTDPWDLARAPDGTIVFDQRGGGLSTIAPEGGAVRPVEADLDDLFASGETGQMGLVLDPDFAADRRFYTCQGYNGSTPDIRVISWQMSADYASAQRIDDPLVSGLPLSSGRHGGCRLRFDADGALHIGTGDAAIGSNPQDLESLGGKTLRVDPGTGAPWPDNPFVDAGGDPLIYSYGHRNVQGLALQPDSGQMFAAEHGPGIDDEINLLEGGGNYGWNPVGADPEDYDESVPMTDPAIEGALPAVWSSGDPTIATSGSTFLEGADWGPYEGLLLVGLLAGEGILVLQLDDSDGLVTASRLPGFDGTYGRIRTVQLGGDGALYVTSSNGGDDVILRVTPSSG